MESGVSTPARVAATLFGLVLWPLVFADTSAITRIDVIGDFSHFISRVPASGFSCFPYSFYCLVFSFLFGRWMMVLGLLPLETARNRKEAKTRRTP